MEYLHYITLTLKEKVNYISNIILNWIHSGVTDKKDIIRELMLNSNNDPEVLKISQLVLAQLEVR